MIIQWDLTEQIKETFRYLINKIINQEAEGIKQLKTNEFTYKVMDLNTAQLEIPRETYQRELSPDRVRRIVKAFDERIANEPKVSYRGGHYYVFDGQHTIAARKLRNDNQDLKVRCKVYFGMSDKDEALLLSDQRTASRPSW